MEIAVSVGVVIIILVVLAYPLWRPPLLAFDEATGPASTLAHLEERKLALYGAIREAGFDLRTDKMTEADYAREVDTLKSEAVEVLAAIDRLNHELPRGTVTLEKAIVKARRRITRAEAQAPRPSVAPVSHRTSHEEPTSKAAAAAYCTSCGHEFQPNDRFCGGCGHPRETHG